MRYSKMTSRYDIGPSKSVEVVLHICIELLSDVELEIVADELIKMIDSVNKKENRNGQ